MFVIHAVNAGYAYAGLQLLHVSGVCWLSAHRACGNAGIVYMQADVHASQDTLWAVIYGQRRVQLVSLAHVVGGHGTATELSVADIIMQQPLSCFVPGGPSNFTYVCAPECTGLLPA